MDFGEWNKIYDGIVLDFGYDKEKDKLASNILSRKLRRKNQASLEEVSEIIQNKVVHVVGGAIQPASLENLTPGIPIIAADDATGPLYDAGIVPDIIVTDLDGDVEKQIQANKRGSITIIHAHGDNIDAMEHWLPEFKGKIMGTTQAEHLPNVHNFGGFTDGDRAVLLAAHFKAKKIIILGFDFDHPVPKPGKDMAIKKKKLAWARKLIMSIEDADIQFI
ncbi:MAG: DUF115 domain-containing protein [Thermoplasmata archaeon]|nr:DUF115 domain-containing protein [Thermoplasmata archaeon]